MKSIGQLLVVVGILGLAWSLYVFAKYIGLGGDNSYTPYTGLVALISIIIGLVLLKRK